MSSKTLDFNHLIPNSYHTADRFLVGGLGQVSARVIMVEDLTITLSWLLGAVFSLNPEFFVEHLHQQVPGYSKADGLYMGEWATWKVKKPYMSARWYRPAIRNHAVLPSTRARRNLEEHRGQAKQLPMNQGDATPTWVFQLSIDGLAAIEERVSIYETVLGGHKIVIMLLDPLPMKWEAEWSRTSNHKPKYPFEIPRWKMEESNPMYKCLVPRYTPDISYSEITTLQNDILQSQYEKMPSTLASLESFFASNGVTNRDFGTLPF
ncbi:hypothetical protein AJ80_08305 [Polytolypa hystricis UAMH7299]|uniref:Uncharacterized protein n=1 Tax=Polytolypa hystricis (strain UAMH7299) TaxID=1447883 RepID=A0A2B7XA20_POLH7|nr:hypothetical protein AJ80_08305 [Polytolypa hystricis UAMH7299]